MAYPSKLPLSMWVSKPYLTCVSLGQPNQHLKRHLYRVSRLCIAHGIGIQSLYFTMGSLPQKIAPSHGDLDRHLIHCSLDPIESTTQPIGLAVFAQFTVCRRACRGMLFPLKSKCHLHMGDLYPHLIRGSLGPPDSASQPECRSVQPSLHSARQKVPLLYNERLFPQNLPLLIGYLDST